MQKWFTPPDFPLTDAERRHRKAMLKVAFEMVLEALKQDGRAEIPGFGRFQVRRMWGPKRPGSKVRVPYLVVDFKSYGKTKEAARSWNTSLVLQLEDSASSADSPAPGSAGATGEASSSTPAGA